MDNDGCQRGMAINLLLYRVVFLSSPTTFSRRSVKHCERAAMVACAQNSIPANDSLMCAVRANPKIWHDVAMFSV